MKLDFVFKIDQPKLNTNKVRHMDDNTLHKELTIIAKAFIRDAGTVGKRLEVDELVNTAYVNIKTGKGSTSVEGGNLRYAILRAANPELRANTHVRPQSVSFPSDSKEGLLDNLEQPRTVELSLELRDAMETLPAFDQLVLETELMYHDWVDKSRATHGLSRYAYSNALHDAQMKMRKIYEY